MENIKEVKNTAAAASAKQVVVIELTPEQTMVAAAMAANCQSVEAFSKNIEEDVEDGLSNSEILELVFGAAQLVPTVQSIIKNGRAWRKQPQAAQSAMLNFVAEALTTDPEDAKSRVAVTIDFAAGVTKDVNSIVKRTKAYLKAIKPAKVDGSQQ